LDLNAFTGASPLTVVDSGIPSSYTRSGGEDQNLTVFPVFACQRGTH
jgi:hypothetical protein